MSIGNKSQKPLGKKPECGRTETSKGKQEASHKSVGNKETKDIKQGKQQPVGIKEKRYKLPNLSERDREKAKQANCKNVSVPVLMTEKQIEKVIQDLKARIRQTSNQELAPKQTSLTNAPKKKILRAAPAPTTSTATAWGSYGKHNTSFQYSLRKGTQQQKVNLMKAQERKQKELESKSNNEIRTDQAKATRMANIRKRQEDMQKLTAKRKEEQMQKNRPHKNIVNGLGREDRNKPNTRLKLRESRDHQRTDQITKAKQTENGVKQGGERSKLGNNSKLAAPNGKQERNKEPNKTSKYQLRSNNNKENPRQKEESKVPATKTTKTKNNILTAITKTATKIFTTQSKKAAPATEAKVAEPKEQESFEFPPNNPKRKKKKNEARPDPDNYDIRDLASDDTTDDEDDPKKKIPAWARTSALRVALINQNYNPPDLDDIFDLIVSPDLREMFTKHRPWKRTSSALWTSPILKPSGKTP